MNDQPIEPSKEPVSEEAGKPPKEHECSFPCAIDDDGTEQVSPCLECHITPADAMVELQNINDQKDAVIAGLRKEVEAITSKYYLLGQDCDNLQSQLASAQKEVEEVRQEKQTYGEKCQQWANSATQELVGLKKQLASRDALVEKLTEALIAIGCSYCPDKTYENKEKVLSSPNLTHLIAQREAEKKVIGQVRFIKEMVDAPFVVSYGGTILEQQEHLFRYLAELDRITKEKKE